MKLCDLTYPERLAIAKDYPVEGTPEIQIDTLVRLFKIRREDVEEIVRDSEDNAT